jgi:hypothetical protein
MDSILERRKFNMERMRIIIAILLVLSALKKFEDIAAQYRENVKAGRFNIEDRSCILRSTRRQATLSPSAQGLDSALRSEFMAGGL